MLVTVLPNLPEPLKKHKKRPHVAHPHSIAYDFLWFGLPHAGSAVAILRRTSHCGETARFLPPFFYWRYTTPPYHAHNHKHIADRDPLGQNLSSPAWEILKFNIKLKERLQIRIRVCRNLTRSLSVTRRTCWQNECEYDLNRAGWVKLTALFFLFFPELSATIWTRQVKSLRPFRPASRSGVVSSSNRAPLLAPVDWSPRTFQVMHNPSSI